MKLSIDLWGEICESFTYDENLTYSIVRNDGKISSEQVKNYFCDNLPAYEQTALDCLTGTVLDIGCGPGRSLRYLSKKNVQCIGIDSSPKTVELAKKRVDCKILIDDFHNILDYKKEGIDGILLNGNNLGLSGNWKEFENFISQAYQTLKKNGILVGHSINPHMTSDKRNLEYQKNNINRGIYCGQIRIHLEYMDKRSPEWNILLLGPKDCELVLKNAGFTNIRFLTNGPYYYVIASKN